MVKGTVKKNRELPALLSWFNGKKGYGFITDEEAKEVFVHFSAIKTEDEGFKTLYENDKVEFEVTQGEKGPQASNVVVLEKAPRVFKKRGPRSDEF